MIKECPKCKTVMIERDIRKVNGLDVWVCPFPPCKREWLEVSGELEDMGHMS